ncbi:hypothetical protein BV25DRAFT_1889956 [Artomyces pyxidatus]|uniref:Uncharacterized protein n=1 Tax=Artomyces pyxidatus TaxID=48021 RepID=A0ACB8ST60_9AGAM|nr:hypothetical protein BV25DRAFT_1889956 [Artomyces pyxidatus]
MPLVGKDHTSLSRDEAPYFRTLAELDVWADAPKHPLRGVLGYCPRTVGSTQPGKLLVCHDFKGGYAESPSALSYTFNFWPLCDSFVYFSHHRVTIPPSGWISAAHRHGVKMLGTLIFEHAESEADSLRLLFGRLPSSKTGPAATSSTDSSPVPVSPHYARILADLAHQRGFDGYLLNFEYHLRADGGVGHARALAAWIALLRDELKAKVGPHAEVIWYDSIVFTGQLRWQDRLNTYNLPFFVPSTGFFTNYTWAPTYPSLTTQFFLSLDPALTAGKTLRDIYTGVDVWGRGSHGGGGLGSYRALEHIDPASLGMSVALFGQAWTWESQQDESGWNWDVWWAHERKLWLGPASPSEKVEVPEMPPPRREGEPECPHGDFRALSSFFDTNPPPDPADLPFCTTFSPGVGFAWFVNGVAVLPATSHGWTDIDKQGAIGDQLWPRPELKWEDREGSDAPPTASSTFCFDDAWMGGNSLRIAVSAQGSEAEDAFFRCVWLPVQSFSVTPGKLYDASIIFKPVHGVDPDVDLDVGLSLKLLNGDVAPLTVSSISAEDLAGGWTRQSLQFTLTKSAPLFIGLMVGFATGDPTLDISFGVLLGQMSVFPSAPSPLAGIVTATPRILWADFRRTHPRLSGTLTWETAACFPPVLPIVDIPAPDDPNPIWRLDMSAQWFPKFAYFNVYVQPHLPGGNVEGPERAAFVGTTGLDGRACRLFVEEAMLPEIVVRAKDVRFYVQGVTDRGEVLSWDRCVFADVSVG